MKTILSVTIFIAAALGQEAPLPPEPPVAPIAPIAPIAPLEPLVGLQEKLDIAFAAIQKLPAMPMFAYSTKLDGALFQIRDRDRDRDRAIEQMEREYERGTRALDKRQWDEAVNRFEEVIAANKARVDAALYWKAYALSKLGRNKDSIAALDSLAQSHPQSRWLADSKALKVEVGQASGKPVSPEDTTDDDIKLMAINSLMQSDPERSVPLLEKLLETKSSPKLRERALFVLSQSDSPKAREAVARVAKGGANPDLQMKAVRNLGVYGGKNNQQLLADVYAQTNDIAIKKQVLQSFMISGERDRLLAAAKSDSNVELRGQAIQLLGTMGANSQLGDLYSGESSKELRGRILQALFVTGNAKQLVDIARKENDPDLKKMAIGHLTRMRSKEGTDYLMELLK